MIDYIKLSKNKEVWRGASQVSQYCREQKVCDKCIFFDEDKSICIFQKRNSYGGKVAPEDWEV